MPTTLHTLSISFPRYHQNLPIASLKKLVKPYKKHLKNLHGDASHPKIQKLLPLLANMRVSLRQESLKIPTLHSNFKKLCFDVTWERSNGEAVLKKYKAPLSRSLAKMKGLTAVSMTISSRETQAANLMLEIIEKNKSTKDFGLNISSYSFLPDFQKLHEEKSSLSKVHEKLTHLYTYQIAWYSFFASSGSLANLSALWLQLSFKEISCDTKELLQFHRLPRLKKLTLDVTGHSLHSEGIFFENLTFPSSLEDLSLALDRFALSLADGNHASSFSQFFKRLEGVKGVKALNLSITENPDKSSEAAKFACLFIKCFDKLEVLDCANLKGYSLNHRNSQAKIKLLDFQEFWTAFTPSKETLQSLSVSFPLIIFPEDMSGLETEFPKLQKLHLHKGIGPATELARFCKEIPNLKDLSLKGVKFKNEENLREFLEDMKEIPKGVSFQLNLNVKRMKQRFLVNCLKEYIENVKVKGRLGMHFTGVPIKYFEAFGEILKVVIQKGCFEPFNIDSIFSVMKREIIQAVYGLKDGLNRNF